MMNSDTPFILVFASCLANPLLAKKVLKNQLLMSALVNSDLIADLFKPVGVLK